MQAENPLQLDNSVQVEDIRHWAYYVPILAGLFPIIAGSLVILGWQTSALWLIQVLPGYAAMQMVTALSFIATGCSLLAYTFGSRIIAWPGIIWLLVVSSLTVLQYIFNFDAALDRLFLNPELPSIDTAPYPGRMSGNTAFCFMLCGVVLTLMSGNLSLPRQRLIEFLLTAFVFIIATAVVLTYLSQRFFLQGSNNFTQMALHTAIMFIIVAIGIFTLLSTRVATTNSNVQLTFNTSPAAWLILGSTMTCTLWAWYVIYSYLSNRSDSDFNAISDRITLVIEQRMSDHEQILFGGVGLFSASQYVEREEWHQYIASQHLQERYPGILGVGFSQRVAAKDKEQHIREIRAQGFPNYVIHPEDARDEYHTVIYLEPFDWRNQRAYGYDMFSEATRREAMERARDTGTSACSGKVILLQETNKDVQAGFLMYVPVYQRGNTPITVEQRRKNLSGFVYSPFRANDLMRGILGHDILGATLQIYDGNNIEKEALLYDSTIESQNDQYNHTPKLQKQRAIEIGGRTWTLAFASLPGFEASHSIYQAWAVLIGGTLISLLLFFITWTLATTRQRAMSIAKNMAIKLGESQQQFRAVVDSANVAIISITQQGNILYFNATAEKIFGYGKDHALKKPFISLLTEKHQNTCDRLIERFISLHMPENNNSTIEIEGRRKNGDTFPMEISLAKWEANNTLFYTVILNDISDRKQMQQALSESEHRYRQLVDESRGLICSHDLQGQLIYINAAAADSLGYSANDIIGKNLREMLSPDVQTEFTAYLDQIKKGAASGTMKLMTRDGRARLWAFDNVLHQEQNNKPYVLGHAQDVTEFRKAQNDLKIANQTLRTMATHDSLTGLCNRALLYEHLSQAILYSKRYGHIFAVMFIDLDKFKLINDTLGHHAGDTLLKHVAEVLKDCIRKSDIAARIGGDEFVIMLHKLASPESASIVAMKIADDLSKPLSFENQEILITGSIGIALYPENGEDPETLVRNADASMYQTKRENQGGFSYYSQSTKIQVMSNSKVSSLNR